MTDTGKAALKKTGKGKGVTEEIGLVTEGAWVVCEKLWCVVKQKVPVIQEQKKILEWHREHPSQIHNGHVG